MRYRFFVYLAVFVALPLFAASAALPRSTVVIGTHRGPVRFTVEIAADEPSRTRGLMYRTHLAPNAAMLFEFQGDHFRAFWMKNTPIPLDMLFIRADGTISSIAADAVPFSETAIMSRESVRAVLEIGGGRAAELGIEPGDKVHNAEFGNALSGTRSAGLR